jgi:hypothetical protein
MIKFFRKIRQKMLTESKFGKYLLYAIGEIVLVVIGILIALSINNWNQYNNDRILEKEYLERIKKDLIADSNYFDLRNQESKNRITNYYLSVDRMYDLKKEWSDLSGIYTLMQFKSNHLTLQDFTFIELTNAGKLNLIKKIEIKDSLINYYKEADAVAKHVKEANEWSVNILNSHKANYPEGSFYFKQRFNNTDSKQSHLEMLNNPSSQAFRSFEQAISIYLSKNKIFSDYFTDMNARAIRIVEMIDNQ